VPPKFEAKANGDSLELLMYGPIGSDWWGDGSTVDAKAVASALAANKSVKSIDMKMNSIGGDRDLLGPEITWGQGHLSD